MEDPWARDLVLGFLSKLPAPVGDLVRAFPGRAGADDNPKWLDEWFRSLVAAEAEGKTSTPPKLVASSAKGADLSPLRRRPVTGLVRLVSIQPLFFRGYRDLPTQLDVGADLVVFEGRNSTGKTGISEALEWLLTGALSRRMLGQYGSARELANCISNEFRPGQSLTSVEAVFSIDGQRRVLKRVLKKDYTATSTSGADSELYVDGAAVSAAEEHAQLEELFAGVHPILMQHTLRQFVHDNPSNRRQYFERLLQIDELTSLIERAVVGDARLRDFPPPAGGATLLRWDELVALIGDPQLRIHASDVTRANTTEREARLRTFLMSAGRTLLHESKGGQAAFQALFQAVSASLATHREKELPLLAFLRFDQASIDLQGPSQALGMNLGVVRETSAFFASAQATARDITAAQLAIARAYAELLSATLINPHATSNQACPICDHEPPTLTFSRTQLIAQWQPATLAVNAARQKHQDARTAAQQTLRLLDTQLNRILSAMPKTGPPPTAPPLDAVDLRNAAANALTVAIALWRERSRVADAATRCAQVLDQEVVSEDSRASLDEIATALAESLVSLENRLAAYAHSMNQLEAFVGGQAREHQGYRLTEAWLSVASDIPGLLRAWDWEFAKRRAQETLSSLRDSLIQLRTEIVRDAQRTFSDDMSRIWDSLRKDTPARFTSLVVPEPRGRGYKLEFELKATIEAENKTVVVDALRVFSESQINALGVAAYITRARHLGHRLLVFDDPVQSMDDEHLRSFAGPLLDELLGDGFQIVILTHNEGFSKAIADHHYQRESYATLTTRATRRQGCRVDEGSRRVAERLKTAERLAEEGRLQEAWRFLRLALERLYLLIRRQGDAGFDPETWKNHTAENMWDQGVGAIVGKRAPQAPPQLKAILKLTVAGAHDKAPPGETDLRQSVAFLRQLLQTFRLAG